MYNKKVVLLGCKPLSIGHKWWRSVLIGQCPSFTKGCHNVHVIVTMTTEACLRARTGLHFLSSWFVRLDARTKKKTYSSTRVLILCILLLSYVSCRLYELCIVWCCLRWFNENLYIYMKIHNLIFSMMSVYLSLEPEIWRGTLSSGIRWPQQ